VSLAECPISLSRSIVTAGALTAHGSAQLPGEGN
jgi:hypothetical protein